MKYLKLYEEFYNDVETEELVDVEVEEDTGSYIDSRGIIHIKNWTIY